jgi:hypothetical protein
MAVVVNLQDVVDALSMDFEVMRSFVDRETGEVVTVLQDDLAAVEEPGPHDDDDETAVLILGNRERFSELPGKWEVNDWEIMCEFCEAVESAERRGHLLAAIRGVGRSAALRLWRPRTTCWRIGMRSTTMRCGNWLAIGVKRTISLIRKN